MLLAEFFSWWYGHGLKELFRRSIGFINFIWQRFSVVSLLKTLFEPWRKIITDSGNSAQERGRAIIDNAVSRMVGFTVRVTVVFAAVVIIMLFIGLSAIFMVAWPLAPLLLALSVVGVAL